MAAALSLTRRRFRGSRICSAKAILRLLLRRRAAFPRPKNENGQEKADGQQDADAQKKKSVLQKIFGIFGDSKSKKPADQPKPDPNQNP